MFYTKGNTLQYSSYSATYLPCRKSFKKDEARYTGIVAEESIIQTFSSLAILFLQPLRLLLSSSLLFVLYRDEQHECIFFCAHYLFTSYILPTLNVGRGRLDHKWKIRSYLFDWSWPINSQLKFDF